MRRTLASGVLLAASVVLVSAQDGQPGPLQRRARAIEALAQSSGDQPLREFVEEHLTPQARDAFPAGALLAGLQELRRAAARSDGILLDRVAGGATRLTFLDGPRETSVLFQLEADPPHRITALEFEGTRERAGTAPEAPPYTWETLAARLDEEAKASFSGTVLVVHEGKIVLHRGYGLANREKGIPNGTETIFAIGSVPIDFTRAAILKLEEMGKLRTSDPITAFFPDAPADKRPITIDHLMRGTSGLPNFHHVAGVDADPDLTWIDRDTAVKRILGQDLLFPPGRGEAHSHSAFVLLAAVVEIAAKQAYGDFLRERLFAPAGMTRTGLHEDAARFPDEEFAVGYEGRPAGSPNIPKHWGRTSWLVMGSGGMQSTPMDLYRWLEALRGGKTLSPAQAAKFWTGGVLAGGDDRGFFCLYTEGPGDLFVLSSNAHSRRGDRASAVGERLVQLVREGAAPKFALGIEMEVEEGGGISLHRVVPGSAAERDGLRDGDVLLSANGVRLNDPAVLRSLLRTGEAIAFEVDRGGSRMNITVRPDPRPEPPG